MLRMRFYWCLLLLLTFKLQILKAQTAPTPFSCPVMGTILNEGPAEPEHQSYVSTINPQTGAMGTQIAVTSATGVPYLSLNGLGIVSSTGFGYAQHQAIPNKLDVITALLAGNASS